MIWPVNEVESLRSGSNDWTPSVHPPISRPNSEAYDFSMIPLGSEGVPNYRAEDEMTMELITEVDDAGELDEDVSFYLLNHWSRLIIHA